MKTNPQDSDSKRFLTLVLATLDYLIENYTGEFVCDNFDPVEYHYGQEKVRAKKYGKQGNVVKLKAQLNKLIKRIVSNVDFKFTGYIKEKTGYDFDVFAEIRSHVDAIVLKGIIETEEERHIVVSLITMFQRTNEASLVAETLNSLHDDYCKLSFSDGQKGETRTVKVEEKDGVFVETVQISIGTSPQHLERKEVVAPDKKRRLFIVEWSNGKQANTSVSISFPTCSGGVYTVEGLHPALNAFWKDNKNVVIETSKNYTVYDQHRVVSSFGDVINVEYIERD